uniref:Granulin a n=1 Tax=Oryzias melastigma TaxID=30732 RepID=A0A3B3CE10_ORYME
MQKWVVICWVSLALAAADMCPNGGKCEEGQTCCKSPTNGYDCCPFDEGECCGDHIHCCPKHTVCDMTTSSCGNATMSLRWVERVSAGLPTATKSFRMIRSYMGEDEDNICPDQSRCPAEFSCLKALTRYGCCPLAQGVSCPDGKHCCPEGHQCSLDSRSCVKKESITTVLCKDGVSECPEETTCCETPEGKWACCPMPKAVCCDDKIHCCPEETTCDVEHMKCLSSAEKALPMWAKFPARTRADWENQKEGKEVTASVVEANETKNSPDVTTANPVPPIQEESPVSSVAGEASAKDVPCNETTSCPDQTTCCKTEQGEWACCPLPEAVCCEDFIHCCPKGKTCNLAAQSCDGGEGSVSMLEKIPSFSKVSVKMQDVQCDDTAACPDQTTCCKTAEGGWACCPLPEAVCCEDFIHCCPKGKTCNLAAQSCDGGEGSVSMLEKIPSFSKVSVKMQDVQCDSTAACPDQTTCCKTAEGGWACCPLPEAVCCEDFIHCCPKGKTCNLAAQSCDGGEGSVPMLEKIPSYLKQNVKMQNVSCDSSASCPDQTTCCKTTQGTWACCPLPEAVCCDDHEHCCPSGTTCDLATLSCLQSSGSVPMSKKMPALTWTSSALSQLMEMVVEEKTEETGEEENKVDERDEQKDFDDEEDKTDEEGNILCDSHTQCPQGTTCCFMQKFQKWGCCPLPKAVCCTDGEHCCPTDYKCKEESTSCVKGEVEIPWYTKIPATVSIQADSSFVQCGAVHQCPAHMSCCRLFTGEWGCCPLSNAVCCGDKEHCCPEGYTCDLTSRSCHKLLALELETVPLTPVFLPVDQSQRGPVKPILNRCDDVYSCNVDETCCRTSHTTWGCCLSPNAMCCRDMKHCCPDGYRCSRGGSCIKKPGLHWLNWHTFFSNKRKAIIV